MIGEQAQGKPKLKHWILARLMAVIVRCLDITYRSRINREAEYLGWVKQHNGAILVTWHGRVLPPVVHFWGRKKEGYHMLVSLSNDGDLISEFLRAAGLGVIRGSTSRRGAVAAREVLTLLANGGVLACAPDGPRGPAYVAQLGIVYIARKSGKPIIPAGVAAWPRWELRSWDRFMIPRPFARCEWVVGDPIFVGAEEDLEAAAQRVTEITNSLQAQAEEAVHPARSKAPTKSKKRTADTL